MQFRTQISCNIIETGASVPNFALHRGWW